MTEYILALLTDPAAWAAFGALVAMEVVLGIDNLIFISILTNKLPEHQRSFARRLGIGVALGARLVLLGTVAWIVQLTEPIVTLFGNELSVKDLVLIAGGLFLVWKATKEIHHSVDPEPTGDMFDKTPVTASLAAVIAQILLLDMVFSIDSIITAVGMTPHIPIMVAAVIITVAVMLLAADPLANFIKNNPTVVMLALGFLLLIGTTLIAEGFAVDVPKGYIYAAMAFSAFVEGLNVLSRRRKRRQRVEGESH